MKLIESVEDPDRLKALVVEDLTEVGVIVEDRRSLFARLSRLSEDQVKGRQMKPLNDVSMNTPPGLVFGCSLSSVPSIVTEKFGTLPAFLLNATELLEKHLIIEGLFRRSASVSRLKDLKLRVDEGRDLNDALPLDIASLVKQFFRELPDPLLTSVLYDSFLRCTVIEDESEKLTAILFLCLLLPLPNLSTLRFIMHFLAKVAAFSEQNKMDASNLAVCLTPNLLYPGNCVDGTEKIVVGSGGCSSIQAETTVIYLLILHAEKIGLVSDTVLERAALFSSCCALHEELEEDKISQKIKNSRKKKRSGSLQGFVTSLSSSFSRWRNKEKQSQNNSVVSDRSALSYISFERSSIVDGDDDDLAQTDITARVDEIDFFPSATPRLVRKRKAEEEMAPFSAKKRQAILSSMPQKSLLARTPFTPRTKKENGNDIELDSTPYIDFASATDITFSATPRVHASKYLVHNRTSSSGSSARLNRRNSAGRYGCFSPKTNKKGIRNSFRGLLRRLSGSKTTDKSDSNSSHLSNLPAADCSSQKSENSKKYTSLFRRKRSHFSPATQTPTDPVRDYSNHEMNGLEEVDLSFLTPVSKKAKEPDLTASIDGPHNWSLPPKPDARAHSSEGGSVGLRRGRPNSLASGLPSPMHHRFSETKWNGNDGRASGVTATGVIDTSPIQKHGSEANDLLREINEDSEQELALKLDSSSNLKVETSETMDDTVFHVPVDVDHNRAFTEDSMMAYKDILEFSTENVISKTSDELDSGGDKTMTAVLSEVSDKTETILEQIECSEPVQGSHDTVKNCKESGKFCKVLADTDSAVDLCMAAAWSPKQSSPKRQSIRSQDSGLGLNVEVDDGPSTDERVEERNQTAPHDCSLMFMKEGRQSISIRGSFRPKKADAHLEVTAEVHKLLSRAGAFAGVVQSVAGDTESAPETQSLNATSDQCKSTTGGQKQSLLNDEHVSGSNSLVDDKVKISADASSMTAVLPGPSCKKTPVLPVTTNLLRVSFRENCAHIAPVICQAHKKPMPRMKLMEDGLAKDQPVQLACDQTPQMDRFSSTPPKIKSALVTPVVANRHGKRLPPSLFSSPLPKSTRTPLKPIKRLQSSPKSPGVNKLPCRMISPGKKVKLPEMTIASTSVDIDM